MQRRLPIGRDAIQSSTLDAASRRRRTTCDGDENPRWSGQAVASASIGGRSEHPAGQPGFLHRPRSTTRPKLQAPLRERGLIPQPLEAEGRRRPCGRRLPCRGFGSGRNHFGAVDPPLAGARGGEASAPLVDISESNVEEGRGSNQSSSFEMKNRVRMANGEGKHPHPRKSK